MPALTVEAFYKTKLAPRLAQMFRDALREILSVQAPTALIGGVLVATTPAKAGAAPRRVSGRLQGNIVVRGNKVYVNMPYGRFLELGRGKRHHPFIQRAVRLVKKWSKSKRVVIDS